MEQSQPVHEENKKVSKKESIWFRLFHKPRVLEKETALYILVSALDFFMTFILLSANERNPSPFDNIYIESNPIARFFLNHWGPKGMLYFKFTIVAVVALITQYIARTHIKLARFLLLGATFLVSCVVIYSFYLYLKGHEILAEFHDLVLTGF